MIIYSTIEKQEMRLDYIKLAEKMWFKEKNKIRLNIDHIGNTEMLQIMFSLGLSLPKWDYDKRWTGQKMNNENLSFSASFLRKMTELEFITDHVNLYTVDKRAFYIMILEVTKEVNGKISEDNRQTWMTTEEFEQKHQSILSLSYDEANEISLNEVSSIKVVDESDPNSWNEDEERCKEIFWENLEEKQLKLSVYSKKRDMKIEYQKLIEKMWNGISIQEIDIINYDEDRLKDYFYLALKRKLDFQYINDNYKIPKYCALSMDEEQKNKINFYTTFTQILPIDTRALYIMVIEVAQLTEGTISEDGGKTSLTLEEFKRKHKDILGLTYEEAKFRSEVKK